MIFYTSSFKKRPVRLSEQTRLFAYESVYGHKYGKDTKKTPFIALDDVRDFDKLSDYEKYDISILKIAEAAPVRICKNEKISGAATLGDAIEHNVPARFNDAPIFQSISHLTIDFSEVLSSGLNGILKKIEASYKTHTEENEIEFLDSCKNCMNAFRIWHKRYLDALKDNDDYKDNYKTLLNVPFNPPKSFHEAVQAIWFVFAFVRLCGNWPGIGRIDKMLGSFLKKDLENKKLTLNEAREILAHFFIKGCEWISGDATVSGDAQHYQNIVLSGVDESGNDITNEVTYLILDIVEELGISDFPITVRINEKSPEKLLLRISEVIQHGGGVIAIYNEPLVIKALTAYGYNLQEARAFANDGCWEVQIPGKTYFSYLPIDALSPFQKKTLNSYSGDEFSSFELLYEKFTYDLYTEVSTFYRNFTDALKNNLTPCTVVSLFEYDCIGKARSYLTHGTKYTVWSPHLGGVPDVANALYAIKKLVFEEKKVTFSELMMILKNNWNGYEDLRLYASNHYKYYGNDNDEVDFIASDILDKFAHFCKLCDTGKNHFCVPGISTFGRQIDWSVHRMATPHGTRDNDVLSGNLSPAPGTDKEGATAIIKSHCKADLSKQTTGAALDICLLNTTDTSTISSLIKSFVSLGGFFMQIDIADKSVLTDAKLHPEKYPSLSVRVSGWNARFVTLSKEWQDMVINRYQD